MKRKDRTAEKAAADPQAVQRRRLRAAAPFGLVFRFDPFRGVCLSRRREAPSLSYQRQAHATGAKVHKQLQIKLRAQENGTYIIFEIADKLLKLKCAYAIIILSNNLDGV